MSKGERIESIDILRGLALFGILAANMRGFAGPTAIYFRAELYWPGIADRVAQGFIDIFVQRKFITIFAFLFGVGFASQMGRMTERGAPFARIYVRRLVILALFGLAHGLFIWFGDILLIYALTGLFLLFFRERHDRTLIKWASIGYVVPTFILLAVTLSATLSPGSIPQPPPITAESLRATTETFASGSWSAIHAARSHDAVRQNWGYLPLIFPQILGLFLAGILAWRHDFFRPDEESLPRYRRVMTTAAIGGVAGNALAVAIIAAFNVNPLQPTPLAALAGVLYTFAVPALSLAYVCAAILVAASPRWRGKLLPFAAVGRMALTNYVLQSIVGTLLFYSYGLGLFGRLGPALLVIPTVVIFAAQVAFSRWWMARWDFGPLEWVWRSLTYMQFQPMRRNAEQISAVAKP